MKAGDLIKHKRTNLIGIIINIFYSKHKKIPLATVMTSGNQRQQCTANLNILEKNWEVLNEAN